MAFDTYAKRRSARRRVLTPRPLADGSFDQGDRQQIRWLYRGNLVGALVIPDLITYIMTVTEVSQPVMEIL